MFVLTVAVILSSPETDVGNVKGLSEILSPDSSTPLRTARFLFTWTASLSAKACWVTLLFHSAEFGENIGLSLQRSLFDCSRRRKGSTLSLWILNMGSFCPGTCFKSSGQAVVAKPAWHPVNDDKLENELALTPVG